MGGRAAITGQGAGAPVRTSMTDHHASGEGGSLGRAELLARFVPGCDPLNVQVQPTVGQPRLDPVTLGHLRHLGDHPAVCGAT